MPRGIAAMTTSPQASSSGPQWSAWWSTWRRQSCCTSCSADGWPNFWRLHQARHGGRHHPLAHSTFSIAVNAFTSVTNKKLRNTRCFLYYIQQRRSGAREGRLARRKPGFNPREYRERRCYDVISPFYSRRNQPQMLFGLL